MTKQPPPINPGAGGKPPAAAIALSTFLFPGVGQGIQGRWGAALIFGGIAFVAGLTALACVFLVLSVYYQLADDFDPDFQVPWIPMLASFATLLITWLVNIADVVLAHRRARLRAKAQGGSGGP